VASHIDTHPVVPGSTQATHWTCPQAPIGGAGRTHHLKYPSNKCAYCGVSRPDLEARHKKILEDA
jgi:hypothetical protein